MLTLSHSYSNTYNYINNKAKQHRYGIFIWNAVYVNSGEDPNANT